MRWADVSGERAASNLQGKIEADFSPFISLSFHRMGAHGEIGGKEWKRNRTLEGEQVDEVDGATPTSSESLVNQLGQVTGCFLASTFATYHTRRAAHGTSVPHTQSEVRVCQERAAQRLGRSAAHSDWDMRVEGKRSHPATPPRLPNHPANQFQSSSFPLSPCRCIVSIG